MKYIINVEEIRNKDVEIEAESEEKAFEIAEEMYRNGGVCMDNGVEVHASLGSMNMMHYEIAEWYC